VLHHPKWPKCKFLHLHQNRSKLIKTGRNRSKQIENDDMIYQKIKKEKRKCIFRTTREFICLNLFRPHSVFFPPKKYYLIYAMFSHLRKIIFRHFFPCPIFFVLLPVLFFPCSYIHCLKVPFCEFGIPIFFQELIGLSKKEKKERGKQKTEKTRQCNLKKNFKKRKKKKIQKMCTPIQQKQTNE